MNMLSGVHISTLQKRHAGKGKKGGGEISMSKLGIR